MGEAERTKISTAYMKINKKTQKETNNKEINEKRKLNEEKEKQQKKVERKKGGESKTKNQTKGGRAEKN